MNNESQDNLQEENSEDTEADIDPKDEEIQQLKIMFKKKKKNI